MIIDSSNNMLKSPEDTPPAYDAALLEGQSQYNMGNKSDMQPTPPMKVDSQQLVDVPGPSYIPQSITTLPTPTVYHYTNPRTNEHVASLLPPDHPEMICLQAGQHVAQTKYGLLGILAAVFWFPLGIGLCLLDRRVRCVRCGLHIDDGLCG